MEEKKTATVSLGTVVCLFIIFILICVLGGMWYYYNHVQNNNTKPYEIVGNNTVNTAEETGKTNQPNNEEVNKTSKKDNSKNIIMYLEKNIANAKTGIMTTDGLENEKYEDFYNTTYDIYENGKNIGKAKGTIEKGQFFDHEGYYISFEQEDYESTKKRIYVSCNYDVVPRQYENIKDIPELLKIEFNACDTLKVQCIDLDGDGKKEYVVAYSEDNKAGFDLYDSNYNKISMIAAQNGRHSEYLSDFDYISYMDIDNDGNMEIIINIPVATSYYRFGIYKYEDNSIKGQIDTFGIGG